MSRCAYVNPETGARCVFETDSHSLYCKGCARKVFDEHQAFACWMEQVVLAMEASYGLHPDDLPDCPYADWHGSGMDADEAACQAIALCASDDLDD